jgi:hypothetical protein
MINVVHVKALVHDNCSAREVSGHRTGTLLDLSPESDHYIPGNMQSGQLYEISGYRTCNVQLSFHAERVQ